MKFLVAVLAVAIGIVGIVAGEADDSPGLQLLGVMLIVGAGAGNAPGYGSRCLAEEAEAFRPGQTHLSRHCGLRIPQDKDVVRSGRI